MGDRSKFSQFAFQVIDDLYVHDVHTIHLRELVGGPVGQMTQAQSLGDRMAAV